MHVPMFDLRVQDNGLRYELLDAVDKVLQHGRIVLGPEVQEFEKAVAQDVGARYAVGVASGSSALYLALRSVGIGPGDEVITTPLTWIITLHAISSCGATPVCVDVQDDFNINPEAIEAAITTRTKAIVPMHYAGQISDMDKICRIAEKYQLSIVEDAAQAYGAEYRSKKAGSFSKAGAFSMNAMKSLSSYGEAGAVVTDDPQVYEKVRMLRHAGTKSDPNKFITNEGDYVALNHKMDTIQAAMLLVAMKYFPNKMVRKSQIAKMYTEGLSDLVKCPIVATGDKHGFYTFPIQTPKRDELKEYLQAQGIETKIFHMPLACDSAVYAHLKRPQISVAQNIITRTLNLPCHEKLSDEQVGYVVSTMRHFLKRG